MTVIESFDIAIDTFTLDELREQRTFTGERLERAWREYGAAARTDAPERTRLYAVASLLDAQYRVVQCEIQSRLRVADQAKANARLIEAIA